MRTLTVSAAGALSLLALLACAPHRGAESRGPAQATERAVRTMIEEYYRDFSDRDWEAFSGHFWPGATLATIGQGVGGTGPSVLVYTVPEYVARAPEGPDSKPIFEERLVSAEVRVSGDIAQVWAHYEAEFGEPGDIVEWRGIDAFTLLRDQGVWKITGLTYAGT